MFDRKAKGGGCKSVGCTNLPRCRDSSVNSQDSSLCSTAAFAALVGINRYSAATALKICHNGGTWRGVKLEVVIDTGRCGGGNGGLVYLVRKDSIPPQFIKHPAPVLESQAPEETLSAAAPGELILAKPPAALPEGPLVNKEALDFKLSIIQRVRHETEPNTPERAKLIQALAQTERYPYGKKKGKLVGETTIRKWVNDYENQGYAGLIRQRRSDLKKPRALISRPWDKAVKDLGLSDEECKKLAAALKLEVRAQWANGAPSASTVQMNVLAFAMQQLRRAGCTLADDELRPICQIPTRIIQHIDQSRARAVAIFRKDAGRSAAIQTPRIKRTRDHLKPMDWVAADVHHIDIAFQRDDGSLCTVKAVAFMDLATNRAFIKPFVMEKGEMIRREHVIEAFIEMCADPNWGVPTRLYLDRGGEFNWEECVQDLLRLKSRLDCRDWTGLEVDAKQAGVWRSRAYNPQSKIIETLFSILTRSVFSQLSGYIGGNRMKKKTENQGKAPVPYRGDFEAFKSSLKTALAYYHGKGQQGHLNGKTPNERFQAFIESGWQSITLDPYELAIAFCKREFREIRAGGVFSWKGREYRHADLISLAGIEKIEVGEPLFGDKSRLILFDANGAPFAYAEPVPVFELDDIAGSGEQLRMHKILRGDVVAMEAETGKRDLEESMRAAVEAMPPEPKAESKGVISLSPQHRRVAQQARTLPEIDTDPEREYRDRMSQILREAAHGGLRKNALP